MPLIVTPGQLRSRGELYHQFGALLSAGVPLTNALEMVERAPPSRSFRKPIAHLLQSLQRGATFTESMLQSGSWAHSFDIALLEAGEKSGRLDACFKLLSDYYTERSQLARRMLSDLAYPLFIVHFAVLLAPFPRLFLTGDLLAYLRQTLGVLVPLYAVAFLLVLACQGRHGEMWRSMVERVCRYTPILGTARRNLALSRLSVALEALINAGVSIISAWELAAAASGSPAIRRAVSTWRPRLENDGQPPSEIVSECTEFPELFANLYHTGEMSGQLDETLRRLHRHYQEEASRRLRSVAEWAPRLVYFAILLVLAFRVVNFWSGYYAGVFKAIESP